MATKETQEVEFTIQLKLADPHDGKALIALAEYVQETLVDHDGPDLIIKKAEVVTTSVPEQDFDWTEWNAIKAAKRAEAKA